MTCTLIAAIIFTVGLFLTTAYFLMGSVPLLTLKHDTPMDSRFVRGFYNTHYLAVMFTASASAVSYASSGWLFVAAGASAIALLAAVLRWKVIPRMDSLRAKIALGETSAIAGFRRIHVTAILVNLAQLVFLVGSLVAASLALK